MLLQRQVISASTHFLKLPLLVTPTRPSGSTRVIQQCKIKKTERNAYELKYTAKESGYHMLSIKLNGHQIHASPFKVRAQRHTSSGAAAVISQGTPSPSLRHRKCPSVVITNDGRSTSVPLRRRQRHSTGSDVYGGGSSSASQINNEPKEDDLLYK